MTSKPSRRWHYTSQIALYTVALASLTAVHGVRYYNEPQLTEGSHSPRTFYAPEAAVIEDPEATKQALERIRSQATKAIIIDAESNLLMRETLEAQLAQITSIRLSAGPIPYISTQQLSESTQRYLRRLDKDLWQSLQDQVMSTADATLLPSTQPLTWDRSEVESAALESTQSEVGGEDSNVKPPNGSVYQYNQAVKELIMFWRHARLQDAPDRQQDLSETPPTYQALIAQVDQARQTYNQALVSLKTVEPEGSSVLLDLNRSDWAEVEAVARQALNRLQAIGVMSGLPITTRLEGIQSQLSDFNLESVPPALASELEATLVTTINQSLQPNLVVDSERTRAQLEAAVGEVEPILIPVAAGQLIVSAGQEIDSQSFLILDHYSLTQRRINVGGVIWVAVLMGTAILLFIPVQRRLNSELRRWDRLLILCLVLTVTPLASGFGVQFSSLPAVGLLLSSFYGTGIGLAVVAGEALLLPLVAPITWTTWVPLLVGSVVTCIGARRLRSREELAFLGGAAALSQVIVQGILSLLIGPGFDWVAIALTGATGLGWSIIALGASPYLERLFDLVTPVRLLELANPNRPLLRRLATEAPGTFQHTLFVATLAERAAQRLNLNVELVRTGTLYHDIGKMLHANYFIENQMGGVNPHVELDDPYRSAQIIKAHISDGLKLARQYRLPTAIQAFIPEHQGTIRIAYFYHQAQEKAGGEPVPEEAFRYDGPAPQTRETGVVMLADACEAALRSMALSTGFSCEAIDNAKATIKRIFKARWEDQQLVGSHLTQADLDRVADAFIEVWLQSNHERIPYPKAVQDPIPTSSTVTSTLRPTPILTGSSESRTMGG